MLSVVVVTLIALCAAVGAAPVRDSLPSPLDLSQFAKQRVMLIVAHPDDGTLVRLGWRGPCSPNF